MLFKDEFHGFCMALADSVPGVSGGTVAFVMGFYDQFIGSINDVVFGKRKEKQQGLKYLIRLGLGWAIGMGLAVVILTSLFESHIYAVSSLFIGFIVGAIPLIVRDEKACIREAGKGILFGLAGILLVVGITWANDHIGAGSMNLGAFSPILGIKLFGIGMVAISAMFLPGISGSTLLLIFGAYLPIMHAIKALLTLELRYLPALILFACGIGAGAASVVKLIRSCLLRYRTQTVYMILGMMIGSIYAIIMGPTTLELPRAALTLSSFHPATAIIGICIVIGMEALKSE